MEWTDARKVQLVDLWKAGHTARTIANELGGVTRNAVIGKAHRLGLSQRPKPSSKGIGCASHNIKTCQWIDGDDMRNPDYCGAPVHNHSSWCREHYKRVFTKREAAA